VVEHSLSGERFVPNDASFESGEIVRLITGPNMSGKSTFLRQVALIVLDGADGQLCGPPLRRASGWWTAFSPASAPRMKSTPANPRLWLR